MPQIEKILITGANGLLGREVAAQLCSSGLTVFAVTHSEHWESIPGTNYIKLDLAEPWSERAFPKHVDAIIHLAQSKRFREFPDAAMDMFKVNIESTARLLDYARNANVKVFINASTGGVYGSSGYPIKENSPLAFSGQLGYYIGSKMCSEMMAHSYAEFFTVISLRLFFMYGRGQNRTMLLPRLLDNIKKCIPIKLQGSEGIRINPLHVTDAAEAVRAALYLRQSATFNLAGPDILSIRQISELMSKYVGRAPVFEMDNTLPKDLIGDNSAMKDQLIPPTRRLEVHIKDIDVLTA